MYISQDFAIRFTSSYGNYVTQTNYIHINTHIQLHTMVNTALLNHVYFEVHTRKQQRYIKKYDFEHIVFP